MKTVSTNRELIAALQDLDPDAAVIVTTGFDNDTSYAPQPSVYQHTASPTGDGDWSLDDEDDVQDDPSSAGTPVVVIEVGIYC